MRLPLSLLNTGQSRLKTTPVSSSSSTCERMSNVSSVSQNLRFPVREQKRKRPGHGPAYRSVAGASSMMTTRCSSTGSATCATAHVSPPRIRVSPRWGTRSVTAYSQAPVGKRMVIDSEATGRLSPLDLARCQVGTAGGRAVGGGSRVADLVLSETLCSTSVDADGDASGAASRRQRADATGVSSTDRTRLGASAAPSRARRSRLLATTERSRRCDAPSGRAARGHLSRAATERAQRRGRSRQGHVCGREHRPRLNRAMSSGLYTRTTLRSSGWPVYGECLLNRPRRRLRLASNDPLTPKPSTQRHCFEAKPSRACGERG